MNQLIAFCGVDCSQCPDYVSGKCPSCRRTAWTADDICMPVHCCREKNIDCCGECMDFPCREMAAFYQESEGHRIAYSRMKKRREQAAEKTA
ncbi:MAG: DUF3795 domain-containing protein [Solobacterium sp.]|nr:DUF3795 domain-containing protein [Solobacterium sp.]